MDLRNGNGDHDRLLDGLQSRLMDEVGAFLSLHPDVHPARVGLIVGHAYFAQYLVSYGGDACKAARDTLELIIQDWERTSGPAAIQ